MTLPELPHWYKIQPTFIGSNYDRYQIIKNENNVRLWVFVKMPCAGMDGCDRCAGPHRKGNKNCSKNLHRPPFINSPTNNQGGIFLFSLFSGQKVKGLWIVSEQNTVEGKRSAIACLVRK